MTDWTDVTPPGLPELSGIYEIEVSPHDPATVYLAITRYRKADDYSPYLLRTNDYGKNWTRLDGTFPQGEVTKTIREDTERRGLLFVGTETGVFTSIDDGKEWRRLNLNMPPAAGLRHRGQERGSGRRNPRRRLLDSRRHQPDPAVLGRSRPEDRASVRARRPHPLRLQLVDGLRRRPPSDKKYYFVRNSEAGYTFYERGVVNGERKREFIDAGEARPNWASSSTTC